MCLNVLLSFAQFEREVIGERVRDKIAASKRKGLWVGGPVPLGYASSKKKIAIVPEEAETVRLIFRRYLELGSIRLLAQDLDRLGIRTKRQVLSNGRIRGDTRFGVGPLAHVLKNRFYIGEVFYRGEIHPGEQEPILDQALFEAVQAKLASHAVTRQLRLKGSPAILANRIFDDRGNRMTPTHANKHGVRYRYYISQALLQNRTNEVGSVARVPAPDIEGIVLQTLHDQLGRGEARDRTGECSSRELIERHVDRVIIKAAAIEVRLRPHDPAYETNGDIGQTEHSESDTSAFISLEIPWRPAKRSAKGVLHAPSARAAMAPDTRDALLTAIAKAKQWVAELADSEVTSFAEIAEREGKVERHVRFLAPIAFVSPHVITAIMDGSAPADLTVTTLAKALPYSWAEQQQQLGVPHS
jgi:site-specific DNA recombinase